MSANCTKDLEITIGSPILAAYWKFDEASGNTRADSTPNGNTISNVPVFGDLQSTTGKISNAVRLNNDVFINGPAFTGSITPAWNNQSVTIAGWFRDTGGITNDTKYRFSVGSGLWDMGVIAINNNEFQGFIRDDVGVETDVSSGVIVVGDVYYFIVIQFDFVARTIGISVDDSALVTAVFAGPTTAQSSSAFQARNQVGAGSFDYDEFGIWYRKLTPAEITYLFNGNAGRTYPDVPTS